MEGKRPKTCFICFFSPCYYFFTQSVQIEEGRRDTLNPVDGEFLATASRGPMCQQ